MDRQEKRAAVCGPKRASDLSGFAADVERSYQTGRAV